MDLNPQALARALDTTAEGAARFQREARQLAGRLGIGGDTEEAAMLPNELRPSAGAAPRVLTDEHADATTEAPAPKLDAVLERWRELDDESKPAAAPTAGAGAEGAPSSGGDEHEAEVSSDKDWIPRPEAHEAAGDAQLSDAPDALFAGVFDGCTPGVIAALERARVRTLPELIAAEPMRLAELTAHSYLECSRWQFLARRAQRELRLSPANAPRPEHGPGGPFA